MEIKIQLKDYLDLFRFSLSILSCIGVLAAGFIIYVLKNNRANFIYFLFNNGVLEWHGIIVGLIATILITSSLEAINDYFDVNTDLANKRFDRPITRGAFKAEFVKNLCILMFISSILLVLILVTIYNVTFWLLLFTIFFIFIGIGYNLGIKKTGLIGNMWVSIGYVAPLFIGFFLLDPNEIGTFTAILMITAAFLLATGREIVKDVQDYTGDKEQDLNSVVIKHGPKIAGLLASIMFSAAIFCAMIAGIFVYKNFLFWSLLVILIFILGLSTYTIIIEKEAGGKKARKYTRWSLWIAIAAFFVGVFFIP